LGGLVDSHAEHFAFYPTKQMIRSSQPLYHKAPFPATTNPKSIEEAGGQLVAQTSFIVVLLVQRCKGALSPDQRETLPGCLILSVAA
tara:strand:+ start:185 stop:445 length:261 start_codon:yes stop_codon:yes gene_type:complete